MLSLSASIEIGLIAVLAGGLGAIMGIGGGVILVPILLTFFNVDTDHARTASLIAVCVTSMAGSLIYLRDKVTDLESASYLQLPTAIGAVCGALLGKDLDHKIVQFAFAGFLILVALRLAFVPAPVAGNKRGTAAWVGAIVACIGAGFVSSLLGVGGGIVFVPVLTLLLSKSPREAAATSTYLIGLTGAASAWIYVHELSKSGTDTTLVAIAIPCVIGIFVGAQLGARVSKFVTGPGFKYAFALVMAINAAMLIQKASHG